MLVGDLSSEQGGKLSGHTSHQSGRDADVGFYATDARGRAVELDHFVAFAADGRAKDAAVSCSTIGETGSCSRPGRRIGAPG